jgi:hypothetical protein
MSLGDLNVATRRRLRRDAWLLTAWCVGLGFATSWVLLHGFGLRQPAARYGIAALVMYALGLVCGARVWLVRFTRSVRAEPGVLGRAAPEDVAVLAAEKRARERHRERVGDSFDLSNGFGFLADLLSLEEAAALLIVPAALFLLLGGLLLAGLVPALLMDGIAGLLAEVAVQFVFGALIARRVMRPRAHDAAFLTIVGRTWLIGVVLVAASVGAGWLLATVNPAGATIADLFR